MRVWAEVRRWSVAVGLDDGPAGEPDPPRPRYRPALGDLVDHDPDVSTSLGFHAPSMERQDSDD